VPPAVLSCCLAALPGVANQPHIVEIYNLTRSVKTSHIEEFLLGFMWGGTTANVKWVDDEHALAVFPCAEAAQVLLQSSQKEFKVRPYNKASGAALQIAAEGEASHVSHTFANALKQQLLHQLHSGPLYPTISAPCF
jgi:hypothetical protein